MEGTEERISELKCNSIERTCSEQQKDNQTNQCGEEYYMLIGQALVTCSSWDGGEGNSTCGSYRRIEEGDFQNAWCCY